MHGGKRGMRGVCCRRRVFQVLIDIRCNGQRDARFTNRPVHTARSNDPGNFLLLVQDFRACTWVVF